MTGKEQQPGVRFLGWDSQFFGIRIGRVDGINLSFDALADASRRCQDIDLDCAYLLVGGGDSQTIRSAEENAFHLVDARLTLEHLLHAVAAPAEGVRHAVPADVAGLEEIASSAHTDTRFHVDSRFDRARASALYRLWISKSCSGELADVVFTEGAEGQPLGYITCATRDAKGTIGLLGVSAQHRGAGIGRRLVGRALAWFGESGATSAEVVTQARNIAALRLYEGAGFRVKDQSYWYHRWFEGSRVTP